jgi:hypothetical protein
MTPDTGPPVAGSDAVARFLRVTHAHPRRMAPQPPWLRRPDPAACHDKAFAKTLWGRTSEIAARLLSTPWLTVTPMSSRGGSEAVKEALTGGVR